MWADWRLPPLWLYYHATLPYRWWQNRQRAVAGRAPVVVLFYHRVADTHPNAWTCPTRVFARQMAWLKRHADLVSLAEAQTRLRQGNPRLAVSVTFDDGYADNCDFALPLLVRECIPCTYFVSNHFVASGEPFPHDLARGRPLPPNTIEQLRCWSARGVEIAAHTRTHCNLGPIADGQRLHDEVVAAGEQLQRWLNRRVRYFAFPYGLPENLNQQVFRLARQFGYEGVCSAYGGYNFPGDDPFHLQRAHGDPDPVRLRNWVTVDPRKLRVPRVALPSATQPAGAEACLA